MRYGKEKPEEYLPRLVDTRIERMLELFGAVEIRGAKWCGKTWSACAFGESVVHVDDPSARPLIAADPTLALQGAYPHVIDEWQEVPAIWDAVRHRIDAGQLKGSYVLTGSSTPEKDKVSHSGAGGIAHIDMATMTLWEQGRSTGQVSLANLFAGVSFAERVDNEGLAVLADDICRGGWPALREATPADALEAVWQYLDALFEVSVLKKGGNPHTARKVARAVARNVATAATLETLAADALETSSEKKAAASTVSHYLGLLKDLYVVEDLTGWDAPIRSKSRLRTKPKRYFADPSIAAAILGAAPSRLLSDGQLFGLLFESLCVHDIRAYAALLPGCRGDSIHYYQDADGLEADLVIELVDGRWAAFEIKLGEDKVPEGIASLVRLRNKIAANPAARNPEPEFLSVVTATSQFARRDRESGVFVLPLTALCP